MKVLHIAARDIVGGAAIASYRLHEGLRRIGVESKMVVSWKQSRDPQVANAPSDRRISSRLRRRVEERIRSAEMRPFAATSSPTLELFSHDYVPGADPLARMSFEADVVHLHWVAGILDHRRFFARVASDVPIVWTLHDMNPFTGGCHYTLGCDRFSVSCGACPQLGSSNPDDPSSRVLRRKHQALSRRRPENTRIVATSAWMAAEAGRSALLGRFEIDRIPYGLDSIVFRPRSAQAAREALDIPQGKKVLLFVAESVGNHRKGFDLLLRAIESLSAAPELVLVAIGDRAPVQSLPFPVIELGRLDDPRLLALAYAAADIFVMPTRAEAFGQVVLEAMACGTPVVSFDVGGVPDMVRPGVTGLLAPPEDVAGLRAAIDTLLADDELRARLSAECRRVVEREYTLELQATRYRALYEELVEASRNLKAR